MALTIGRWVSLAIAGCVLAWVALVGTSLPSTDKRDAEEDVFGGWRYHSTPAQVFERQLAGANARLRLIELRDSLVRAADKATADGLVIQIDQSLMPELRTRAESLLRRQWGRLAIPGKPATGVVVAIVVDTLRSPHGLPSARRYSGAVPIDVFLPSPESGGRCVALAHLSSNIRRLDSEAARQMRNNLTSPETIEALLGPCALYAAFGQPGPHISKWLFDKRWAPARLATWNEPAAPWLSVVRGPGFSYNASDMLALSTDPTWRIRQFVAPVGISCLAAGGDACRQALIESHPPATDSAWRANVVASSGSSAWSFFAPQQPVALGPADASLVSEMVRTLGFARFSEFWRSPMPVPDAFERASGQNLDSWTRDWARRMYGPTSSGPVVSGRGLQTGALILAAGLFVAAVIATRRRVV